MNFSVYKGSGRATCKICNKIIEKGDLQVNAKGGIGARMQSGNAHYNCIVLLAAQATQ